ncbi:glycosyl hydrolase family 18 protein [Streptomyces sp. HK10]|uniref:glycosyl hydrolase family 18 protein n=1 Tax=Streptomyces sp. HK10 TaxID=3373255 RepID=UPI003748BD66
MPSPARRVPAGGAAYGGRLSAGQAARAYVAQGVPAWKVLPGVPFYGWKDVPPDGHGLPRPTGVVWKYDAGSRTFWTFDDASVVRAKAAFVREHGLGGVMVWPLDGDDARGTLLSALDADLRKGS